MTPPELLRLAADLLEQSERATSEREKEGHYYQAMLIIAQIMDAMMEVELEHGGLTPYMASIIRLRRHT